MASTPWAADNLPAELKNIPYEFREDVPRVSDSDVPICIKSLHGKEFKVHAHLMGFASEHFRKLLSQHDGNENGRDANVLAAVIPGLAAQKAPLFTTTIYPGHIFAINPLAKPISYQTSQKIVELFVRWAYKRCERQASTGGAPLSPGQLAAYFLSSHGQMASRYGGGGGGGGEKVYDLAAPGAFARIGDPVAAANHNELNAFLEPVAAAAARGGGSFLHPETLLGAWILGGFLGAPEFQNTVMTVLHVRTKTAFTARQRCELALRALSPIGDRLPDRIGQFAGIAAAEDGRPSPSPSPTTAAATATANRSRGRGDLYATFVVPSGSALEHFLLSRVAAYFLTPLTERGDPPVAAVVEADGSSGDGDDGFSGLVDAVKDFVQPLLHRVPMTTGYRLVMLLVEELAAQHYGAAGPLGSDDRFYV
ncbi:hypothetical protein F5X96DRAFT_693547 [Biscogniauxia mediterranea]|nr:hypothetical protein F5X96DRAFT_693547 [Biscogniauxia mediterranea]